MAVSCTTTPRWSTLYGSSGGVRCMAVSCTTPTSGGVRVSCTT